MKKLYFSLLAIITFTIANAQIVNIPDANFKAKLLQASPSNYIAKNLSGANFKIDFNNDGEIQESEALQVGELNVSYSNISDLTGINSFLNLTYLRCDNNHLTTLDVSNLVNLTYLNSSHNEISTLDVSNLVNLSQLWCIYNQLTTLDVSNVVNLAYLTCNNNQLTTLDASNLVNLSSLQCYNNQLTTLNVGSLVNLTQLWCYNNQLTTFDVSDLVNLNTLYCSGNHLTTLDVINLLNLNQLWCDDNQLISLIIKNNNNIWYNLGFSNNPNLQYICADEEDITLVQGRINLYGYINCTVNSNCTLSDNTFAFDNYFTVYPIPAKDILTISSKQNSTISSVSMYNILGQIVLTVTNPNETIDVSSLKTGSYIISIVSDKGTSSSKFVKE